jgi:hypothetical protein
MHSEWLTNEGLSQEFAVDVAIGHKMLGVQLMQDAMVLMDSTWDVPSLSLGPSRGGQQGGHQDRRGVRSIKTAMSIRKRESRKVEGWAEAAEEVEECLRLQLPVYMAKYMVLHLAKGGNEVQRLLHSGEHAG